MNINHAAKRRIVLAARDGFALSATLHSPHPSKEAKGAIVILGATAVPRNYYDHFARQMAQSGFLVISFDYRGMGESRPRSLRGFNATMCDWASLDASAAIAYAREMAPGLSVFAVGHSFGGHTIGLRERMDDVDAMILVGSQLPYWKHWSSFERLKVATFFFGVVPTCCAILGYVPGSAGVDQDLPKDLARDWARWASHPDYFIGHIPEAEQRLANFDRPVLCYSFSDDWFAPGPSTLALTKRLKSAKVFHRHIQPADLDVEKIGHFGFFRPSLGNSLWPEVVDFFDNILDGNKAQMPAARRRASRTSGIDWSDAEIDLMTDLAFGRD